MIYNPITDQPIERKLLEATRADLILWFREMARSGVSLDDLLGEVDSTCGALHAWIALARSEGIDHV